MNSVHLIGRLVKDPELRYGGSSQTAIARFTLAINRIKTSKDSDPGADFPNIICFGKTAEFVSNYIAKGTLIAISGRIQTGKYEKDGKNIYTTDVIAERVESLERKQANDKRVDAAVVNKAADEEERNNNSIPEGFAQLDEDIPF